MAYLYNETYCNTRIEARRFDACYDGGRKLWRNRFLNDRPPFPKSVGPSSLYGEILSSVLPESFRPVANLFSSKIIFQVRYSAP